jgi:hypothetical protein
LKKIAMRSFRLTLLLLLSSASVFAQTGAPRPAPAAKPLHHDSHDGMTVSADPYIDAARVKDKFGKADPLEAGVLPLEVFLHNESNQALRIKLDTVQLEVRVHDSGRQDIDWLTPLEVADLIAHPHGPTGPQARRLPGGIPLPNRDKKTDKLADILRPFALDVSILPPQSTIHGFLFFNLAHHMSLAETSSLYVPDVVILPANRPLIFFEVPLGSPDQPQAQTPN